MHVPDGEAKFWLEPQLARAGTELSAFPGADPGGGGYYRGA